MVGYPINHGFMWGGLPGGSGHAAHTYMYGPTHTDPHIHTRALHVAGVGLHTFTLHGATFATRRL